MNPKSLVATVLLLVFILLLGSTAPGCVNFEACYYYGPGQDPTHANIALYDNDFNNAASMAIPTMMVSTHLNCGGTVSASWDPNTYVTTYQGYQASTDRPTYTFQNSVPNQATGVCSASCQFGCSSSDCFVAGPNN
ncbi:unnamed protein product [Calypogeia fissa]